MHCNNLRRHADAVRGQDKHARVSFVHTKLLSLSAGMMHVWHDPRQNDAVSACTEHNLLHMDSKAEGQSSEPCHPAPPGQSCP